MSDRASRVLLSIHHVFPYTCLCPVILCVVHDARNAHKNDAKTLCALPTMLSIYPVDSYVRQYVTDSRLNSCFVCVMAKSCHVCSACCQVGIVSDRVAL